MSAMREKEQQPALSVEDQIINLENLGLKIDDKAIALSYLNNISYFRMIKAFSLGLKGSDGKYKEGVSMSQLIDLYEFNCDFRHLLFPVIETVEINMRCRVSNYFSIQYGVLGYEDVNNFANSKYHEDFLCDLDEEIYRNRKSLFVKNFQQNYSDGKIPMYAAVELFSFGMLSKFFKNMKPADKKAIAKQYGLGYTYLESWLECAAYVRNICAHYGRLYNTILIKRPQIYAQYTNLGIDNSTIFGVLVCTKHLLMNNSQWITFVSSLKELFEKYPVVDKTTMGFPDNWQDVLVVDLKEL